jgi:hypothetical protein
MPGVNAWCSFPWALHLQAATSEGAQAGVHALGTDVVCGRRVELPSRRRGQVVRARDEAAAVAAPDLLAAANSMVRA